MDLTIVTTVLSVAGGAFLAFQLNGKLEERKARIAARNAAYVDFLTGIVEVVGARNSGQQAAVNAALIKVASAKMRIGIYGGAKVIDAIIDFYRAEQAMDGALLDVYEQIRADGVGRVEVSRLSALVFSQPKKAITITSIPPESPTTK